MVQPSQDRARVFIQLSGRDLTLGDESSKMNISDELAAMDVEIIGPYVGEIQFIIRTDHQAFRWISDLKGSTGRLEPWRLRLMGFDFELPKTGGINKVPGA